MPIYQIVTMKHAIKPVARNRRVVQQRGVTLIEVMVGLAVGLLATLVIAQSLSVAEGLKRTTTAGSDAQVNGAIALYTIQRDVQMAGYGLSTSAGGLGCPIRAHHATDPAYDPNDPSTYRVFSMVPVQITDGASNGPDTINFMVSTKPYAVPVKVTVDHPRTAANFFIQSTLGFADNDLVIAVPKTIDANNWCSLFNVTGVGGGNGNGNGNGQGQNQVIHDPGSNGPWNQPGGQTIFPTAGYPADSYLINVGQFVNKTYSISAGQSLHLQTFTTFSVGTTEEDLYPHVVNLQAMYGKDTDGDGVVDTYDNTTPTDSTGWSRVLAVRVAVIARSANYEKDAVTFSEPLWDVGNAGTVSGSATCGSSRCLTLKVNGLVTDWDHYRYKVYDTVVPLRNVIWTS